jgi:hypothetical protein
MLELKKPKKPAKIAASTGGGMSQSPYRPKYVEKRPPCMDTCPNGTKVRDYIQLIAQSESYDRPIDDSLKLAFLYADGVQSSSFDYRKSMSPSM